MEGGLEVPKLLVQLITIQSFLQKEELPNYIPQTFQYGLITPNSISPIQF